MRKFNLAYIKSEVRSRIHNSNLSVTRITNWANTAQDWVVREMDPKFLEGTIDVSTVVGQRTIYVEASLNKIKNVSNETAPYNMVEVSETQLDVLDPEQDSSGSVTHYSLYGMSEVSAQPSAAATVSAVSTSALDTTQTIEITGLLNGVEYREIETINGLGAVTTTQTFDTITGVRLSAACAGLITVTSNTGTVVTLVKIPANKLYMQYQPIHLYSIPGSVEVLRIRYLRQPRQLVTDNDIPELPVEWYDLILLGTMVQAHEDLYEFDIAQKFKDRFDAEVKNLRKRESGSRNNTRKINLPPLKTFGGSLGKLPKRVG